MISPLLFFIAPHISIISITAMILMAGVLSIIRSCSMSAIWTLLSCNESNSHFLIKPTDWMFCLPQNFRKVINPTLCHQRNGLTSGSCSSSSSNSMKVNQWLEWNILIDNMSYCWNTNTPCCYISCYEDIYNTFLKFMHSIVSLPL